MVTKRQIEKAAVYLLFSLFIQFSTIEIRWVFSHAALTISYDSFFNLIFENLILNIFPIINH